MAKFLHVEPTNPIQRHQRQQAIITPPLTMKMKLILTALSPSPSTTPKATRPSALKGVLVSLKRSRKSFGGALSLRSHQTATAIAASAASDTANLSPAMALRSSLERSSNESPVDRATPRVRPPSLVANMVTGSVPRRAEADPSSSEVHSPARRQRGVTPSVPLDGSTPGYVPW